RILNHTFPRATDRLGFARGVKTDVLRFAKERVGAGKRVFGKAPVPDVLWPVAAGGVGVLAIVGQANPAIVTEPAIATRLDDDFIAFLNVAHAASDRRHNAGRFMPRHERELDVAPNPFNGFEVGGAKPARAYADEHLAVTRLGGGDFVQFELINIA